MIENGAAFAAYERSVVNGVSFSHNKKAAEAVIGQYLVRLRTLKQIPGMPPSGMPREPSTIIQLFTALDGLPKEKEETPNIDVFNGLRWQMIAESFGFIENQPEWLILNQSQRELVLSKQKSDRYKN